MLDLARLLRRLASLAGAGTTVVALAALLTAPGAAADSAAPLLPDLVTLKPADLTLEKDAKALKLRFSNSVADVGVGPMDIRPKPGDRIDCNGDGIVEDHYADQRIYGDENGNGFYDQGDTAFTDTRVGCKAYHPSHHHWHFTDFASYKLRRASDGAVVAASTKVSFCLFDGLQPFPDLPGSAAPGQYAPSCQELDPQGLSVGWADVYTSGLPGQALNVTGLPSGNYCLISTADPRNRLSETRDGNNSAERRLRLHPLKLAVEPLPGRCGG
jgi:hypothetical protein